MIVTICHRAVLWSCLYLSLSSPPLGADSDSRQRWLNNVTSSVTLAGDNYLDDAIVTVSYEAILD